MFYLFENKSKIDSSWTVLLYLLNFPDPNLRGLLMQGMEDTIDAFDLNLPKDNVFYYCF